MLNLAPFKQILKRCVESAVDTGTFVIILTGLSNNDNYVFRIAAIEWNLLNVQSWPPSVDVFVEFALFYGANIPAPPIVSPQVVFADRVMVHGTALSVSDFYMPTTGVWKPVTDTYIATETITMYITSQNTGLAQNIDIRISDERVLVSNMDKTQLMRN